MAVTREITYANKIDFRSTHIPAHPVYILLSPAENLCWNSFPEDLENVCSSAQLPGDMLVSGSECEEAKKIRIRI